MDFINVFKPSVGDEEAGAVREVIRSRWIGLGPKTKEFEDDFAQYVGSKYAAGMNSGTAALHLALKAFDIDSGEVLVPSLSFVSTTHAVVYNHAKPVWVDVEEDTLCLDIEDLKNKITPNTKAIMPVHFGGHSCNMDAILEIAEDHNLRVIEDAAHACGADYKGRKIGSLGDATCFSFHAVKNLTSGEGGMVTLNNEDKFRRLRKLRWVGISKDTWDRTIIPQQYPWYYEVDELGFKYHMSDVAAAIGLVQLKKLDKLNDKRRDIVSRYNEELRDCDWIELPIEKDYTKSSWHAYVIKVEKRDEFYLHMRDHFIACGVHYLPTHMHPYYKKHKANVPKTERVWKKLITMPLYPDLTDNDFDRIIAAVKSFNP